MLEEIKKNRFKEKDYENAANMSAFERKISFLNRYFVYKKIREVNTEKVELELGEYQEFGVIKNAKETRQAIDVARDEIEKIKPRVRKLSKKLLLVAATEAIDEPFPPVIIEQPEKDKKEGNKKEKICPPGKVLNTKTNRCIKIKPTATSKNKKKLIIESDSDEE
jgi:hypothetical protein